MSEESGEVIEIPHRRLPPQTLQALIEEYVTRDGTDYGATEATLARKTADVLRLLESGEAKIVFDPQSASVNIVSRRR